MTSILCFALAAPLSAKNVGDSKRSQDDKAMSDHYDHLGSDAGDSGHWDEALKFHEKAVKLNPRSAHAQANYGRDLFVAGRLKESEEHTLAALAVKPDALEPTELMAAIRSRQGRYEDSLVYARKGRAINPAHNNSIFVWQEVHLLHCMERFDEAVKAAGNPSAGERWEIAFDRSHAALESGNAQAAYDQSFAYEAEKPELAASIRAEALVALGRLREAAALAPGIGDDRAYVLGLVAARSGNRAEAVNQLTKARAAFAESAGKKTRRCGRDYVAVVDAELKKLR